jgi:hypothetical protein
MLNGVTQGNEPLFRSKLEQVQTVLSEIAQQACDETLFSYWTSREVTESQAAVLVESRFQAKEDVEAALEVIEQAIGVLPPVEETDD